MFSKIFKPDTAPDASAPTKKPAEIVDDRAEWDTKLAAAAGDDAALLAIASESRHIDVKCAAIAGLTEEESLKRAEKTFREHDRKVHREAKRRLEEKILTRETRATAAALVQEANALLAEANVPANRLVTLDHAWTALPHAHLTPELKSQFDAAWGTLTQQSRERGDAHLKITRWVADAERVTKALAEALQVTASATPETLSATLTDADALLESAPNEPDPLAKKADHVATTRETLATKTQHAKAAQARLTFLVALPQNDGALTPAPEITRLQSEWRALPTVDDEGARSQLEAMFTHWRNSQTRVHVALAAEQERATKEAIAAEKIERRATLNALLDTVEAELAAGQATEMTARLAAVEMATKGMQPDKKQLARIEALTAEVARLKGWQHWGGGRARDDLVIEAETLAKVASGEKLALKAHAEGIEKLRERWKEIDKLGGATNKTLWLRFETALKTAFEPIAAQQAKIKAARDENLKAREALIKALDATPFAAAKPSETAAPAEDIEQKNIAPDWKALARALEHFQTEWRKLGPLEHTVPKKSQAALVERMRLSVARLESPLGEERRKAQLQREKLIEKAKSLATNATQKDAPQRVRDLQGEWQTHAKLLPLDRRVENQLWGQFKAATDAVFATRDAAHAARTNEWSAAQTAREALIAKLNALDADTPANEIRKTVSEVESSWRRAAEPARNVAGKLDAMYRSARERAQKHLAGSATRAWGKVVDALMAKLALCEEVEAGASPEGLDLKARWGAILALPAAWETTVTDRFHQRGKSISAADRDARLLQLESALGIASPVAFQEARRVAKLQMLKNALEGKAAAPTKTVDVKTLVAELIAAREWDAAARARLQLILEALRAQPVAG